MEILFFYIFEKIIKNHLKVKLLRIRKKGSVLASSREEVTVF